MACQPCWVRPGPDSMGVDQPSLLPLTLPLFSVGDLGGQMGLFIGASILTLLEILDYIYEARNGGLAGLRRQQGELWEKRRGRASLLVDRGWLGSPALGSLLRSPDWLEGLRGLRSQQKGKGEEDQGVLVGVCSAASPS